MGIIIPIELPVDGLVGNDCVNCIAGETPKYCVMHVESYYWTIFSGWFLCEQYGAGCGWQWSGIIEGYPMIYRVTKPPGQVWVYAINDGTIYLGKAVPIFYNCINVPAVTWPRATITVYEVW